MRRRSGIASGFASQWYGIAPTGCGHDPREQCPLVRPFHSDVDVIDARYSDTMGHAGAVILHPDGMLEGAHDPRADGGAAGV
jgi:hypothetical protein